MPCFRRSRNGLWGAILAATLGQAPATAQTLTADDFFNGNVVHEVRLTINPSDWQRLKSTFQDNTYYPCNLRWRGVSVENVGIRSSGHGSRSPVKPNLRVDIDRYEESQEFLGVKSFRLKANNQDPSLLHERLTMLLFQRMGLPAPRQAHARLYINDQYAGAFLLVESVDKRFLKRHLGEDGGYLYEYQYAFSYNFEYRGQDPAQYSPVPFSPETNEKNPEPRPIEAMVRTINQASDADFQRAVSEYLDLRLFLTHLAAEQFMADVDGILGDLGMANFFIYRFAGKNLFQFLVWDKDNTFSSASRPSFRNAAANVLARRALANPELRSAYMEALARVASAAGGPDGWLEQQLNRQYDQIRTAVREDPVKQCPILPFQPGTTLKTCSNEEFEAEVVRMRQFARERSAFVLGELAAAGYQPPAGGPLLSQGGAVNAASSAPFLTAGSLASIYGEGLGTTTQQAATLPLPTTLGGVSVSINGFAAPLVFVSPNQLNVQAPWELAPGTAAVMVVANGTPSNTVTSAVQPASPGIFVVVHADGGLVSDNRPAGAGDILLIYATGLGAVTEPVSTGHSSPSSPLAFTREAVAVRVGDASAEVLFAGLAPGFVGLYQINVRMPPGVAAGSRTPLTVSISGQTSPPVNIPTR